MMKKITKLTLILTLIALASCKKYLEKPNKLQADIQTADQLEALINNATLFSTEGSNLTAIYSTDDTEISQDLIRAYPTAVSLSNLFYYVWDVENVINAGFDDLWTGEFKKIFTANVILSNLDNVSGTRVQKDRIKADAYFIRAMSNWILVNHYCKPSAPSNMESPGLPLKKTTDYTENLSRASLKATYEAILSDVTAAQELLQNGDVVANQRWRVSRRAIDAFLSRFYLFTGDYDKCIQSATSALSSTAAQLVDLNTIASGTPASYTNPNVTLTYSILNDWAPNRFLYWGELYYTRFSYNINQWYIPSQSLRDLYDPSNDMRYRLFIIPNGGRRFSIVNPAQFRYTYFNDGRYIPAGPTVAEVLLNKAEAQARKGELAEALNSVNLLRQKRLRSYTALTAANSEEAISKILQERRRELPFAFRWMDIRRFSVNQDPSDDVILTRNFFKITPAGVELTSPQTYTLPVNSLRYSVPINGIDIAASQGQIQQNNY
jgi:starch-binding outer membrane protein, SusD/RagB family